MRNNMAMAIIPSYPNGQNKPSRKVEEPGAQKSSLGSTVNEPRAKEPKSRASRSELLSAKESLSDKGTEQSLRPQKLAEYIGQTRLKSLLEMSIAAAKTRQEPLDHILFYGPPGLGKTTLAHVIANEMGSKIYITSGPALERPRDILGLVHQLEAGDVLFIDEIHRLSRVAEELLYPAVEDFVIDLSTGKGHATRSMRLPLPRFTLIGATTKAGAISNALRDRFGFVLRLEYYDLAELSQIVRRTSQLLGIKTHDSGVEIIAARARGTPRIANRLVRLVRDFAQYKGHAVVDAEVASQALETYQVDKHGLDPTDRRLLEILIDNYGGGPVGVDTIAATLGEDPNTVEDVYEPYLMQKGFIQRTPRGRMATANAYRHLGRQAPLAQLTLDLTTDVVGDIIDG